MTVDSVLMKQVISINQIRDWREFVAIETSSEDIKVPHPFQLDSSVMFSILEDKGDYIVLDRIVTNREGMKKCVLNDNILFISEIYMRPATCEEFEQIRTAMFTEKACFEYPLPCRF